MPVTSKKNISDVTRISTLHYNKDAEILKQDILRYFTNTVNNGEFCDFNKMVVNSNYSVDLRSAIREITGKKSQYSYLFKKNFENWSRLAKEGKIEEFTPQTITSIAYCDGNSSGVFSEFTEKFLDTIKASKIEKVQLEKHVNDDFALFSFNDKDIEKFYASLPDTVKELTTEVDCSGSEITEFQGISKWLERTTSHPDIKMKFKIYSRPSMQKMDDATFNRFAKVVSKAHSLLIEQDYKDGSPVFGNDNDLDFVRLHETISNIESHGTDTNLNYELGKREEMLLNAFHQKRYLFNKWGHVFLSNDEQARNEFVQEGIRQGDRCLIHYHLCDTKEKIQKGITLKRRQYAEKADKILHTGQFFTKMKASKIFSGIEDKVAKAIARRLTEKEK